MAYKTKSRFESAYFQGVPEPAASQLRKALTTDPGHIVPDRMSAGGPQKLDALRSIQEALNKLQSAGVFLDLVAVPKDEIDKKLYGSGTEKAVLAFKKKLDIRRPGQQEVDPITGMSTLSHLDDEIMKLEGKKPSDVPPGSDAVFVDVIVHFEGGANYDSPGMAERDLNIAAYRANSAGKRRLLLLGIGAAVGKVVVISAVKQQIDRETGAAGSRRGVICIHGSSLGGRHALDLAMAFTRGAVQIDFLGLEDAAFSITEATNTPEVPTLPILPIPVPIPKPINTPLFQVPAIASKKPVKNYYQTHGNLAKPAQANLSQGSAYVWWSDMWGAEIHGKIEGTVVDNVPLNGEISFLPPNANRYHVECGAIGQRRNKAAISALLNGLV